MNSVPIIVDEASLNDRLLNKEQNSAFQDINQHILSNSAEPLCLLGSGGKRTSVNSIIKNLVNSRHKSSRFQLWTPTLTILTEEKKLIRRFCIKKLRNVVGWRIRSALQLGIGSYYAETQTKQGFGSMRTVEGFIWLALGRKQRNAGPEAVLVRFDDPLIALRMPELATASSCIKVETRSVIFQAKRGKRSVCCF